MDDEIEAQGYALIRGKVAIELEDGTVHEKMSEISRGTPQRPMDREELFEKFTECTSLVYESDQIAMIEALLYKIDTLENVHGLVEFVGEKVEV